MPHWSHQRIMSILLLPLSSHRQFFSKDSKELPLKSPPSSWASCKYVLEWFCYSFRSQPKMCRTQQFSKAISIRCEPLPSKKNPSTSHALTPFVVVERYSVASAGYVNLSKSKKSAAFVRSIWNPLAKTSKWNSMACEGDVRLWDTVSLLRRQAVSVVGSPSIHHLECHISQTKKNSAKMKVCIQGSSTSGIARWDVIVLRPQLVALQEQPCPYRH